MFNWLFGKKDNFTEIKNLLKVLNDGININIKISGDINVEQEGRNSLASRECRINPIQTKTEEIKERKISTEEIDTIPNFKKLSGPKVNFGEEKEA